MKKDMSGIAGKAMFIVGLAFTLAGALVLSFMMNILFNTHLLPAGEYKSLMVSDLSFVLVPLCFCLLVPGILITYLGTCIQRGQLVFKLNSNSNKAVPVTN